MATAHGPRGKRGWRRAAAVVLSFAAGCLSAAPPNVPPGWTVYFHQETPYFYNEKTGETTWDQPRPALPTPTAAPGRTSTEAGQHPRRQSSTERHQVQDERGLGGPNAKRGWFGRGRAAPTKPQPAAATALQARQPWRSRDAGDEGMEGYVQAANHEGRTGDGGGGGGGGGRRDGRSQEQWVGEGVESWSQSGQRRDVAEVGSRQEQRGRKGGEVLGPGSFGGQGPPGAFSPYEPEAQEKRAAAGWGKVEDAEPWNPSTGGSLAVPGTHQGSTAYDPAVGGGGDSSTGGSGDAGGTTCEQPGGSDELIPADAADVAATGGAAAAPAATGGAPLPRSDASDGSAGGESDDLRGWSGGNDISGVFVPPAETGVGGTEKAALSADARDQVQSPQEVETAAGSASDEGGDMESRRRQQQQQAQDREKGLTEKGRDREEETLQAVTVTSQAEEKSARKDATAEEAGPSSDGMAEWFSPPQDVRSQNAMAAPRNTAWGEKKVGGMGGRMQTSDDNASKVEGGGTLPVRQEDIQTSAIGGEGDGSPGHGEQLWAFDFQPQPEPPQQQQPQPQQRHYGGDGVRHEAEGWDWADPWGQGDTWGAPAWGAETGRTLGSEGTEGHPPPSAPPESGFGLPAAPPVAVGGNGWLDSSGKHDTSVGFAATAATDDAAAASAAVLRGANELELEVALAEAQRELQGAREAVEELRAALKKREDAEAAAVASAAAAEEKAVEAVALVTRQAEEAKSNATALGQWLVTLGLEQEELKGQLAAAQSNSTSLVVEMKALENSAREAEARANSSEAKLNYALEDVTMLDEGLKQYMDGDGRRQSPSVGTLSWKRVSEAYLRPLLPSKLKAPTPGEVEAAKLNVSLGRALENNTALAEAVHSKDDLVKDLNSRIKQFQLHAVRRKRGYRTLKVGLAELTREVQAKESMVIILAVCLFGTKAVLEGMSDAFHAQRADVAIFEVLLKEREETIQALSMDLDSRATSVAALERSLQTTESALAAVAISLGAEEDCVQRWKGAVSEVTPETGDDEPLAELLNELHAAAACKFPSPLGLEHTTGAITIAIPRAVVGQVEGTSEGGDRGRKSPGFWGGVLNALCCRRRTEGS